MAESSHANDFKSSFGPMPAVPIIHSACPSDPEYPTVPQALDHPGAFELPPSHMPAAASNSYKFLLVTIYTGHLHSSQQYRVIVKRGLPAHADNTCDRDLFMAMRYAYNHKLRAFWQRCFSLGGLKYIGILEYSGQYPVLMNMDILSRNSLLYAFYNPSKLKTTDTWVNWVFALKNSHPRRYGLEFVQGWDERKIIILGAVSWVSSVVTAILWGILGDVQTGISVATYVLTASGTVLALLAIVSTLEGSIDAGGETGIKAGLSTVSSPRPATTNLPFP